MAIIGFNFTKIAAQKLSNKTGKVQVNNNIAIKNIEQSKFSGDEKRSAVRVVFRYDGVYEPKIAHMQFEGDVLLMMEKKEAEELVKGWEEKKAPVQSLSGAMNHVLERCTIEGVILARDMNLPSPVPLPKVNAKNAKQPEGKTEKSESKSEEKSTKK